MKTYDEYIDSGVEWIGEIPKGWKVERVKRCFELKTGTTPSKNEGINSDVNGYNWFTPGDFNDDYVLVTSRQYIEPSVVVANNIKLYPAGTILLVGIGATLGKIGFTTMDSYSNQQITALIPQKILPKFAMYYFVGIIDSIKGNALYTTLPIMNNGYLSGVRITLPTQQEQDDSVAFLDSKCASIDKLVAAKEEQNTKLKAYRQSVITKAVTKGLNPDAPMKDSGVEWIGEVPKGWEIQPLKYNATFGKGLSITKADLIEEGVPVISYGQIHSKLNTGITLRDELLRYVPDTYLHEAENSIAKENDIVFADTSEDFAGIGNCVMVDRKDNVFAGYHTIITKFNIKQDNKYWSYLFQTNLWRNQLRRMAYGIKVFSITQRMLRETQIIIPTKNDRSVIASYLDTKCASIDKVLETNTQIIAKLKEYKQSLIYEVVTGKRRVS